MKKTIALTTLLTLVCIISFSQEAKFGLKGGLNIANQNLKANYYSPNSSSLIGFNVGGFINIKISNKFSVQPELLFSLQGGKSNFVDSATINYDPIANANIETTDELYYINVPVMIKYFVNEKFSLELGPQLGILVNSNRTTSYFGTQYSSRNTSDIYNSIDYGINLGAGCDITKNISVGIRYYVGMCNIGKYETDTKNNVFSISTEYKF